MNGENVEKKSRATWWPLLTISSAKQVHERKLPSPPSDKETQREPHTVRDSHDTRRIFLAFLSTM